MLYVYSLIVTANDLMVSPMHSPPHVHDIIYIYIYIYIYTHHQHTHTHTHTLCLSLKSVFSLIFLKTSHYGIFCTENLC